MSEPDNGVALIVHTQQQAQRLLMGRRVRIAFGSQSIEFEVESVNGPQLAGALFILFGRGMKTGIQIFLGEKIELLD